MAGGSLQRGLEEGGAVKFKYAVDWAERALHSYRANTDEPDGRGAPDDDEIADCLKIIPFARLMFV